MSEVIRPLRFAGRMIDTLYNLVTGLGTAKDKTQSNQFGVTELNQFIVENMYRGDWIARKIVNTPAADATREWRQWQAENDQIELIEEVERDLNIQMRTRMAMVKARLYGGAALILGVDDRKDPSEELDIDAVGEGGLRFVHAVSRHELSVEGGLETDLMSPYFGEPRMYVRHVKGIVTNSSPRILIHPSRVIRIQGEEYPNPDMSSDGWGESILQSVYDAVRNAGMVSQAGAVLIDELKVDVIKIPDLTLQLGDQESTNLLTERLSYGMLSKSLNNALVMDKDDEWERVSAQLAGLPEVIKMYLLIAAGAADIPATRLLGQSPSGLNSTGESDIRNYYDRIASDQENYLTPTLSRLDEVIIRSATGGRDDNIWYEWNPLWQMTENELADIAKKKAEVFQADVNMMLIPTDALTQARKNTLIEDGTYPGIELALEESDDEIVNPKLEAQLALAEKNAELNPPQPGAKVLPFQKKKTATKDEDDVEDYNPDQPRDPGGEGGGQWVSGGSEGGGSPISNKELVTLEPSPNEVLDTALSIWDSQKNSQINDLLRNKGNHEASEFAPTIKEMDKAFQNATALKKDALVYRGVSNFKPEPGTEFVDNGFTSTSTKTNVAKQYSDGTLMAITVPKGTKVLGIPDSPYYEVLLNRGTKYKVISHEDKKVHIRVIK